MEEVFYKDKADNLGEKEDSFWRIKDK